MTTEALKPAPAAPVGQPSAHIPSLDGMRAVSFALVFLAHSGLHAYVPASFGVTVFFFLSGYLITTLMRAEREKTGSFSFRNFYLRRVLRILPPFYLAFMVGLLAWWAGLVPAPREMASVKAVLLHYANYYIVAHDHDGFLAGTGVYWSLAVEEHFYLLFPLLYWCLARMGTSRKTQAMILLSLCGLILAWRCVLVFRDHAAFVRACLDGGGTFLRTSVASDARFDSILFGCALALHGNPIMDESRISERAWKYRYFPLAIAGLLISLVVRSPEFRETLRTALQGLCLVPIFVCAIRYPAWLPMRPLNLKAVAFLGTLSYTLYLIHLLILIIVRNLASRSSAFTTSVFALVLSVLLSWAIFLTVEKPCARLRRLLTA